MDFRTQATYDIVAPTSMGVRITPSDRQPVGNGSTFSMQATSAESNVLSISAGLGRPVKVLTAFVEDSPVSTFIKRDLRRRGIAFEGPDVPQGGPWGYRHQFNIADSGFGPRGPKVWNDRAGEVGRELSTAMFDTRKLFEEDGVRLLHLSGLIAALSPETARLCVDLAKTAKAHGTVVSFDLNFRASFWKNRNHELGEAFDAIAKEADILIGNEEDFQLALGIEGPQEGGTDIKDTINQFKDMIGKVQKTYPQASLFATTLREVESANRHHWGAIVKGEDGWTVIEPGPIDVHDRIGGGDGFVGGLLYGLLQGMPTEEATRFAWATGAYVATLLEDYGLPQDEDTIRAIMNGNARVKR
jgi:2-dehydro-3-deoxygluconokinase